jgi:cytochrome P450
MTQALVRDIREIDISDHAYWRDGPPFDLFARMREEAPVHWSPLGDWPEESGFWSITRAEDAAAISRDTETFSSERGGVIMLNDFGVPLEIQTQQMISMDPPRHDRLKGLVQKPFAPRVIAGHEERVRQIVNERLDLAEGMGPEIDLVRDVARWIPARVVGAMLGCPPEDDEMMLRWINEGTAYDEPELRPSWDDAAKVLAEGFEYFNRLAEDRRENPKDDLITDLVNAEVDGDRLEGWELVAFIFVLLGGGLDSTRAVYSSAMKALMEERDHLELLCAEPERIPTAVEEAMRCFPPFGNFRRTATRDVELHGETIREGDKVVLWYLATNRDPALGNPDPERFDVTREEVVHQAFGAGGRHFCLGASLARLELRVMFEETLRRFPKIEPAGEAVRVRSVWLNQLLRQPVRLRP